jgi:pyruvate dehydrogenase E2 component (dihydrolipoamide acetyltransferase)
MATEVIMPALGVAQQTGTLLKWLKAEGQSVSKGEPLMEVETDKATVEIEAAASGILKHVTARPGDEVPVGRRIALILAPGEQAPSVVLSGERVIHPLLQSEGTAPAAARHTPPVKAPNAPPGGRFLASPAAKRLAREKGIPLATLRGSGPEGSVLAQDVLRAAAEPGAPAPGSTGEQSAPLSTMRRVVGQRMTQSKQNAPHFYLSMDIDMTAVLAHKTESKESGAESIPSINDFILLACARVLADFPSVNSIYTEQGIKVCDDVNIGVAVALEEGLVVPVIRNAARLSLKELAAQSRELANKAQSKKLLPLDYEGGTFTVSNLGMLDVDNFIAIINPPQCAILAVGRVAPRVVTDGDGIEIKSMMTVTLSADHRIIDGAIAARFLHQVKQVLETGEF